MGNVVRPAPRRDRDTPGEIAGYGAPLLPRRRDGRPARRDVRGCPGVDWPGHLEKLTAFWCRALLGQVRYRGNPLRAHQRVHDQRAFIAEHFERWRSLFHDIVAPGWTGRAQPAREFADHVARAHRAQLLGRPVQAV